MLGHLDILHILAALLLARTSQREREISIRFSLGASRRSIIFQLLTECGLLALLGASFGLFVAAAGSSAFRHFAKGFARTDEISLNWQIVLYTFACAGAATLLCGLVPAIRGTRRDLNSRLARNSRSQVSGRHTLQWLLVATQVALAVMLLVGAGLLLRSFQELNRTQLGFETSHVLTFRISGNWGETVNYPALTKRINLALETIRSTSGVIDAATAASLPGIPADTRTEVKLVENTERSLDNFVAQIRFVSAGYFTTLQIPILAGDACQQFNDNSTAVVNRSFAQIYMAGNQPIGRHLAIASDAFLSHPARIVGIAADTRDQGQNIAPSPTIYWCTSAPFPSPYFLVHTHSDPMSMAETLRRRIHALEPSRSVFGLSPLEGHLSDNFVQARLRAAVLSLFALTAISLASIGLYGTLSYLVTSRKREVGLRLALGALRGQILLGFLRQGLLIAAAGCAVGLCLAAASSRFLAGMLFGVSMTDSQTFFAVISLVLMVAGFASFAPALRAAGVEPMDVLREE